MRHIADSWQTTVSLLVPRTEMLPRVGCARPARARKQCGLPCSVVAEDGIKSAGANSALTPRSAAKRPNCLTKGSERDDGKIGHVKWKIAEAQGGVEHHPDQRRCGCPHPPGGAEAPQVLELRSRTNPTPDPGG